MARSSARCITLKCVHCTSTRSDYWWSGDRAEEWNAQVVQKECESCHTSPPHWELQYGSYSLRARSSSKAIVVYELPDGDYMSVDTTCPEMVETGASVGVRREMHSLAEVREFCREKTRRKMDEWRQMDDEGLFGVTSPDYQQWEKVEHQAVLNDVLNYDESSIRESRGHMGEEMRERRRIHDEAIRRFKPARDGSIRLPDGSRMRIGDARDRGRYERLKRGR